jgi:single-stranded-DNA-specific exonuclease
VRWIFPESLPEPVIAELAGQLGVSVFTAELLIRRGFGEAEKAAQFLDPRLKSLRDPFLLPDMEAAVERVLGALERGERIVLYGDYDVDGVTSLALLTRVLRACGAEAAHFLPHRINEGYGLSAEGVVRCLEEHRPALLLAVDCGTTSVAEIASLRAAGVDVIVLDHHQCPTELPVCAALVNPKRGDSDHRLCSVGIAFKFAHALLKRRPAAEFDLRDVLDLAALGTVADLVPLLDENRLFVKHGLARLETTRWPGLRALIEVAGLRPPFTARDLGFGFGPRLNAAGRLGTARDALELLLTDDPARASVLARGLDQQNRERRLVEDQVCLAAEAQLATWFEPARHAAIVVGASEWHPGVVGIVASRVQRRHHRPTIVVGFDEAGVGKGSGRSITGLSLVSALGHCAGHLVKFGGHELAAGLSVQQAAFPAFRDAFLAVARETLTDAQLRPRLHLDAELPLSAISIDLLRQLEALAPFGIGHRSPTYYTLGVSPATTPRVLKEKHVSLCLRHGYYEARAIWFNGAAQPLPPPPWDVAFELVRNEYQGRVTPQMQVVALRAAEPLEFRL